MCSICHGYEHYRCPVCGKPPSYVKCDACDGQGELYMTDDGVVDHEKWLTIPEDERFFAKCEKCYGTGEVEIEF